MVPRPFITRFFFSLWIGAFFPLPTATLAETKKTAKPLSVQAVQINVPFVKQEEPRDCGMAVLKMTMGFYGKKLSQAQIDWVKENSKAGQGTMAAELVTVLNQTDFETALFQGTLDQESTGLYHHLDKHRPLIVMITSKDGKDSHYDVVTGYDPVRYYILLVDPALGPLTVARNDFEAAWKRANNFTLLAVPKKLLAQTPTPTPIY